MTHRAQSHKVHERPQKRSACLKPAAKEMHEPGLCFPLTEEQTGLDGWSALLLTLGSHYNSWTPQSACQSALKMSRVNEQLIWSDGAFNGGLCPPCTCQREDAERLLNCSEVSGGERAEIKSSQFNHLNQLQCAWKGVGGVSFMINTKQKAFFLFVF